MCVCVGGEGGSDAYTKLTVITCTCWYCFTKGPFHWSLANTPSIKLSSFHSQGLPLWVKVMNIEIILLGTVAGIASTYSAIKSIINSNFSKPCYLWDISLGNKSRDRVTRFQPRDVDYTRVQNMSSQTMIFYRIQWILEFLFSQLVQYFILTNTITSTCTYVFNFKISVNVLHSSIIFKSLFINILYNTVTRVQWDNCIQCVYNYAPVIQHYEKCAEVVNILIIDYECTVGRKRFR